MNLGWMYFRPKKLTNMTRLIQIFPNRSPETDLSGTSTISMVVPNEYARSETSSGTYILLQATPSGVVFKAAGEKEEIHRFTEPSKTEKRENITWWITTFKKLFPPKYFWKVIEKFLSLLQKWSVITNAK